ncbi:MAG TPA: hypothetical protein VLH56_14005 [Dissulfurispiraceae bacterium]|nr:hypothetical protein [Dissulfurispiraceae bacterium]
MSFVHGSSGRFYVNGFNLSAFLKSVSGSEEIEAHDSTTFGATAKTYVPGLVDATLSAEGLFSGAVAATDAVLSAALRGRTPVLWNWLPAGDVDGAFGYGMSAISTSYEIETPVDDLVSVSTEAQSNTGMERTQVLHPLAAQTATGNGVARDHGAATTAGGAGYLQVMAASGTTPNLVARVQHSVDNSVWVDLITFAAVTAANVAQRLTVAGTVNRWTRTTWAITGTTPSFTLFAAFGRN